MEKIVRQTMLYDFYGDLLTQHQRDIYEEVVLNDTGYSEIAQREGISRQSVHDLIRRCDRQLEEYEASLHLLERFLKIREQIQQLLKESETALKSDAKMDAEEVHRLASQILEEL